MIKVLERVGLKGTYLNIIKAMYIKKTHSQQHLHGKKKLKLLHWNQEQDKDVSTTPIHLQYQTESTSWSNKAREGN